MRLGDRPRPAWLGLDTALALAVLLATQLELWLLQDPSGPRPLLVLVDVVACGTLAWRRRQPLVAVAGTVASLLLPFLLGVDVAAQTDPGLFYAVATLIAVHGAAAYLPLRPGLAAGCLVLAVQFLTLLVQPTTTHAADYLYGLVLYGGVFAAGRVQAGQRDQMRLQAREANRMLLAQQERERQAKLEERRQIARELHDVIAHGIALMVVQAGAAEALLESDPAGACRLLRAVQDTGAQAANDLRRQLGLLGDDGGDVKPAPRLVDVGRLVAELRFSGLDVTFHADGPVASVEAGIGLAAYRVAQEALTNVVKHAPDAHVDVGLNVGVEAVEMVVTDDGGTGATTHQAPAHDGRGLIGMRERVELYDGELTTGAFGSGFRVLVRLPLQPSPRGSSAGQAAVR